MDRAIHRFANASEFETWLEANHATAAGIWLVIARKGASTPSVTYAEALDAALCFGWIDGQKAKHDDEAWLQYFVKRKKGSVWSRINRTHIERLEKEGRMRLSGRQAVEQAKASGQWEKAYSSAKSREVPVELATALKESPRAQAFFDALDSQNRFAFVFRVSSPKGAATRERKAHEFVRMMEDGKVFYPKRKG